MRTEVGKSENSEKKANRKGPINRQTKQVEREGIKSKIMRMGKPTQRAASSRNKQAAYKDDRAVLVALGRLPRSDHRTLRRHARIDDAQAAVLAAGREQRAVRRPLHVKDRVRVATADAGEEEEEEGKTRAKCIGERELEGVQKIGV
jgi:hypothetical protein